MTRKTLVASVVYLALAGCVTDKIAMSSEVGGGSSRVSAFSLANTTGLAGSTGGTGLGVTGNGGVLDNVVGTGPLGGSLEDMFGTGNPVSAILGSGSNGLVPSAAGALAGDPDAEVVGLGVFGDGGLLADLAGTDMVGGALDGYGVVGASMAGGNDGLLGSLLNGRLASPPLAAMAQIASVLPASALDGALAQLPSLGLTGGGGLAEDLIGTGLAGNLAGTGPALGGGKDGQFGNLVPAGGAPLGTAGNAVNDVLGIVAGNTSSPAQGVLAPAVPALDTILGTGASLPGGAPAPVSGALGAVPGAGSSAVLPSASPAGAVTGALANVPVAGGLLGGL